jgi:CRP-like cAMP-binding protein
MADTVAILKQISTFAMLPDDLLQVLAGHMEQKVCADEELLFRVGDPGDSLYIIGSGQITIFLEIAEEKLTLQEFGPGQAIGELALIDGYPRSASAMANGETVIWQLEREAFRGALLDNPELVMAVLADILGKLRFATSFIEEVVSWSRSVAEANYDEALAILDKAETEDMERIGGFLQAFAHMISEVKAREEAYQEEVDQLRIIIDEKKRDRQVQAIESTDSFQYLVKEAKRLRARKRK